METRDEDIIRTTIDDVPATRTVVRREIPDEPGFIRKNFGAIVWAAILVLLAIFIGQNWRSVRIEAFFWSFNIELSWALIAAAVIGIILGWLVPIILRRRNRHDRRDRD